MKKRFSKRSAFVTLSLLLIGLSLSCYVWVRREQRLDALDRQLIATLFKLDTRQARILVEAGANPNTKEIPAPDLTLSSLVRQLLHPVPLQASTGNTAFLIACGSKFDLSNDSSKPSLYVISSLDPRLVQTMLLHGAKVNSKDPDAGTALGTAVLRALYGSKAEYKTNKEIITQLLDHGADPDGEDKAYLRGSVRTPMQTAIYAPSFGLPLRPDLVALLRKYRKHP